MRLPVGAARSTCWRSWLMACDTPTRSSSPPTRSFSSSFSRFEPRRLDGALGDQQQPVGFERLLDELVGADLDRRHRRLDGAVAADHHHRQARQLAADDLEDLQPVELAALQPDVEHHQRRLARADGGERLGAVAGLARLIALILEDAAHQHADIGFVVDDEDVMRHGRRSSRPRRQLSASGGAAARGSPRWKTSITLAPPPSRSSSSSSPP